MLDGSMTDFKDFKNKGDSRANGKPVGHTDLELYPEGTEGNVFPAEGKRPGRLGGAPVAAPGVARMLAPEPAWNAMEGCGTGSFGRRGTVPRSAGQVWCGGSRVARWRVARRFRCRVGGRFGVRTWIRRPGATAYRRWRAVRAGCSRGRLCPEHAPALTHLEVRGASIGPMSCGVRRHRQGASGLWQRGARGLLL